MQIDNQFVNKLRRNFKFCFLTILFIGCNSNRCFAGGIDKLMQYATDNGAMVNLNKGAVVNDQLGGFTTAGSLIMRGPRPKNLQPLTIQTPSFKFDACTGSADFRFGGFSFVNSHEWQEFMKKIGSSVGMYGVQLLLKTASPMIADIYSYIETVARDINALTMNQCAAAQKIAGGALSMLNSGNQQLCMSQGNYASTFKDLFQATEECKRNPDRLGSTGMNDEFESQLGNEFNLVWKALSKNNIGNETTFKELMMSVSGTIIGEKINGKYSFTNKPSLVASNDLLENYIGVGSGSNNVKLYKCIDSKCLKLSIQDTELKPEDTIYGNIARVLRSLVEKIYQNKGILTDDEESVIAFSTIPLINLIELEIINKTKPEDVVVRVNEFIEVVCFDVVTTFLEQMLVKVEHDVQSLSYSQITDSKIIKDFVIQARDTKKFLNNARFTAYKRMQIILAAKERFMQQEREFEHGFIRLMQSNI